MSREVLQMALEVLKGCLEHPDAQDSIIAIEHELAQPEHPEQMARLGWQYVECPACGSEGARAFPKPEESTIKQSLTVEQEPVEWYDKIMGVEVSMDVSTGEDDISHRVFGRVYEVMLEAGGAQNDIILAIEDSRNFTSPPQRQPLTDDEIDDIWAGCSDPSCDEIDMHDFARAIEAAHGIGDKT